MGKSDFEKALNNYRLHIQDSLEKLLNDKKFDEIFDMFEKYYKIKNDLDKMERNEK